MNDLQSISSQKHGHLFATLNPLNPPSPTSVLGHYAYSHPILSTDSVRAQSELALLNAQVTTTTTAGPDPERSGRHRVFTGAWTRYGFHEDGFASGLRAAVALPGVDPPFFIRKAEDIEREMPSTSVMPVARLFGVLEFIRAFAAFFLGRVLFVVFGVMGSVGRTKAD
jgi:predicted NAD/FAD-binding protein